MTVVHHRFVQRPVYSLILLIVTWDYNCLPIRETLIVPVDSCKQWSADSFGLLIDGVTFSSPDTVHAYPFLFHFWFLCISNSLLRCSLFQTLNE